MVVLEERVKGPHIPLLIDELLQLRIMRDRVDHPRKGSKDLSDAVCGSIYNSISRSLVPTDREIKIHTYESMSYEADFGDSKEDSFNLIKPPKSMPNDLQDAIGRMMTI